MLRSFSEIELLTQQQASSPKNITLRSGCSGLLKAASDPSSRHLLQIEKSHRRKTGATCVAQLLLLVHSACWQFCGKLRYTML